MILIQEKLHFFLLLNESLVFEDNTKVMISHSNFTLGLMIEREKCLGLELDCKQICYETNKGISFSFGMADGCHAPLLYL